MAYALSRQQPGPLFPSRRAFIVHFTRDSEPDDGAAGIGRVEHVVSGESHRFEGMAELIGFMRSVLEADARTSTEPFIKDAAEPAAANSEGPATAASQGNSHLPQTAAVAE